AGPADGRPWAVGGFAGGGLGIMLTNASQARDLAGPFDAVNLNGGWGLKVLGLQLSWGHNDDGNLIWTFTYSGPLGFPSGGGYGGDLSYYTTNTWSAGTRDDHMKPWQDSGTGAV